MTSARRTDALQTAGGAAGATAGGAAGETGGATAGATATTASGGEASAGDAVPARLLTAADVAILPPTLPPTRTPPGASTRPPEQVWYASYGSNLLRERFRTYLVGGTPPGARHTHPPSEDPREPGEDVALVVPGALGFAGNSASWGGGGVAFWHPEELGRTLMRGWRLSLEQFLEVLHLENGGQTRERAAVPGSLWRDGQVDSGLGWYGRVVVAGEYGGLPVVTFTAPSPRSRSHGAEAAPPTSHDAPTPPGPAYARVVRSGLVETFGAPGRGGLTPAEAERYVAAAAAPGRDARNG